MNFLFVRALLTFFSVILGTASARAVSYIATLLHPVDYTTSIANDVSSTSQVGSGRGGTHPTLDHALLWQGTSASVVDLHPATFTKSFATGASDTKQVGYGQDSNRNHALLWSGTADSVIDLHPSGYRYSVATGIYGDLQVGYASFIEVSTKDPYHALLWNGTASTAVDLHPAGFKGSQSFDVSSTSQVGRGCQEPGCDATPTHALLWHGTAASVIDLNPAGFYSSTAWAVYGEWQVGEGLASGDLHSHALLWNGNAESVIDLSPPNSLPYAIANDISAAGQVGAAAYGPPGHRQIHATYWNGSAASAVDLHPFLSNLGINFVESVATSISDEGIIAGYAATGGNIQYAVMWTPVPEPTSFALVACAIVTAKLFINRRRPLKPVAA